MGPFDGGTALSPDNDYSKGGRRTSLSVREVFDARRSSLALEVLTPHASLDRPVVDSDISSPGLALSGFMDRFAEGRLQVFGQTEMSYLAGLNPRTARDRLRKLFGFDIPAVFVTKGQDVPDWFLELAVAAGIAVFRSALSTRDFFAVIKPFLEAALAPRTTLHGSLADVYGVGLLFVGQSGVGKSECVLDLVERGHRLVADDLVMVSRHGNEILIGKGHELQSHHMEIRGIGIIDVAALFGIRAIRLQKRIEVIVHLEYWDVNRKYGRTGLEQDSTNILGVNVPRLTVPLNPGKNITVVSEVIAMNHLLRYAGVDAAAAFDQRVRAAMTSVQEYLEQDYE